MQVLFIRSAVAAGVFLAGFQLPSTPPMKLGLWESRSTTTMSMPGMNMNRPPMTTTSRSCVTADTWAKAFANSQRQSSCQRTNERYAAGRYSFDVSCPDVNGTGHGEMNFLNDTGNGSLHMDMSPGGHQATTDMKISSHFVSADCGSVAPGTPQVVH